jgi:hypothetical protein
MQRTGQEAPKKRRVEPVDIGKQKSITLNCKEKFFFYYKIVVFLALTFFTSATLR